MFILFIAIFLESPRSMMTFRIHEWKKQGFKILKYHETRFSLSLHFNLKIILLFALKLLKVFNPETYIIFADYCTMSRMFVGFPIFLLFYLQCTFFLWTHIFERFRYTKQFHHFLLAFLKILLFKVQTILYFEPNFWKSPSYSRVFWLSLYILHSEYICLIPGGLKITRIYKVETVISVRLDFQTIYVLFRGYPVHVKTGQ